MADIAIKVDNVSKRFKLYKDIILDPVKEHIFFWRRDKYYKSFWAVKNASFEIRKGEVVGIIGSNGAGKSTLLKMLAGLLKADRGRIAAKGKVSALLTLGAGFHPEFTGRENILYGGMLLGMSKQEVLKKMDSIIDFAELGEFIDRPLRTYSSGMKARLMFATSMSIDPDILIVDEALATGDTYFVQKSSGRIRELCESGATILFVSHNLQQIQEICQRAFFMAEGQIINDGEPSEMINEYYKWVFNKEKNAPIIIDNKELHMVDGTGEIIITDIKLKSGKGEETTGFYSGKNMYVEIYYRSSLNRSLILDLFVGIILSNNNQYVGEISTQYYVESLGSKVQEAKIEINKEGVIKLSLKPLLLLNNHYSFWIIMQDKQKRYCEYRNVCPFFVSREAHTVSRGPIFWQPCNFSTSEIK